jgi:hypothetical protein
MELLHLQLHLLLVVLAVLEEEAVEVVEIQVLLREGLEALAVFCYTGNKEKL